MLYISGSLAYDRIMDFPGRFSDFILPDKIHILNVSFTVNGMKEKFGGTAGNIAYTLSLLEEKPLVLAAIGRDYERYFEWLIENGIPTDGIRIIHDEFTAGAYITTDMADNQITGFNPGAMKHRSNPNIIKKSEDADIGLIAAGNLQDMIEYADIFRSSNISYICDPGQSLPSWQGKDLVRWISGSEMLISNDYELELIMKMTGCTKDDILSMTHTIITTLGENGSVISNRDEDIPVPAAAVTVVKDPTGAGDAYRAGIIKGLVLGRELPVAARIGAVAAAYVVECYGTQEHRFTRSGFIERYRSNFGDF